MKQFLHDLIHLTQGEMLIKYWWIWLLIVVIAIVVNIVVNYNLKKADLMFISRKQEKNFYNLMALDYRVTYDQAKEIYRLTNDKKLTQKLCSKINTSEDYKETIAALILNKCDYEYIER